MRQPLILPLIGQGSVAAMFYFLQDQANSFCTIKLKIIVFFLVFKCHEKLHTTVLVQRAGQSHDSEEREKQLAEAILKYQ